jgi:hypothetical protein
MRRSLAPSALTESTKAIVLHRVPMIAVITLHRTALAIMQAELIAWRNTPGGNGTRTTIAGVQRKLSAHA